MATPRLVIVNLEQGTDEWKKWRGTVIGASDGLRAMGMSETLYKEKIGLKDVPYFENAAMRRGSKLEDEARQIFEMNEMVQIKPLCGRRAHVASSGDGIDRKVKYGLEIKCPSKVEIHEKHIEGNIEPVYRHQMMQTMYVFGLKFMYFVSYMPEHEIPYHQVKVPCDKKYISSMVKTLDKFWDRVENRQWVDSAEEVGNAIAKATTGESMPALVSVDIPVNMKSMVEDTVSAAKNMVVTDDESASEASDILKGVAELRKKVDAARVDAVKPHNDYVNGINSKFKPLSDEITEVFNALKLKVANYLTDNGLSKSQGSVGKVSVRLGALSFKVEDESLIPAEYMMLVVDDKKVKEALKKDVKIAGIKITTKRTIVAS